MATRHLRWNGRTSNTAWSTRAARRLAKESGYLGHSTKGARYHALTSKRRTRRETGRAHRLRRDFVSMREVPLGWDPPKLVESVLVLLHAAKRGGREATAAEVAMAIWLADWGHLGEYGRPVTYDVGHASAPARLGDVPTMLMAGDPRVLAGIGEIAWTASASAEDGSPSFEPARPPDIERVLSQSDVEALEAAWAATPAALREDRAARNRRDLRHRMILADWKRAWDNVLTRFRPTGLLERPMAALRHAAA